jgi:beta-lactamase regulating signal transducer with metallopeptidase domain
MNIPASPPGFLIILGSVSTGAVALAWTLALIFRAKSAAFRHFLWLLAFAAPLLALTIAPLHTRISLPILPCVAKSAPAPAFQAAGRPPLAPPLQGIDQAPDTPRPLPRPRLRDLVLSVNPWWAIWLLGALFEVVRICLSHMRLRRLVGKGSPASGDLLLQLNAAKSFFRFKRPVRLLANRFISVPFVYGVFRPTIFFPHGWREWDDERIAVCLTHEMAHIVRGDLLAMLAGQWTSVLCWFNPLIRYAATRLRDEAENAADDLVLSRNIPPERYASNLVGITEECQALDLVPAFALSVAPVARGNRLAPRVVAILDSTLYRKSPGVGLILAIALPAAGLLMASMSVRFTPASAPGDAPPSGVTDYLYEPNPQKVKPKMYNWEVQLTAGDSRKGPYEILEITRPANADPKSPAAAKVLIDPEMIVPNANGVIDFMLYVGNKEPAPDPAAPGNIGEPIKFSGKGGGTGEAKEIDLPGATLDRVTPAGKGTRLTGGQLHLIQFIGANARGEKFQTDVILSPVSAFPQLGAPETVLKKLAVINWTAGECVNPLMLPGNYEASSEGTGSYAIRCLTAPASDTGRWNTIHIFFQASGLIQGQPPVYLRRSPLTIDGRQASWGIYRTVVDGIPVIRKEVIIPNFLPRRPQGHDADYICIRIDATSQEMIDKLTPVAGGILRDADWE